MEFKATSQNDGTVVKLKFSGSIDEDTQFPAVELGGAKQVDIDLNDVKSINSVGIRGWLDWIRPLAEQARIHLTNSPKAMVFQFNMVAGFLPPGTVVESFYVPFYCEKCDKEQNILFTVGREVEVKGAELKINFDPKTSSACAGPDCELEMDVTEAKYFGFLKRA